MMKNRNMIGRAQPVEFYPCRSVSIRGSLLAKRNIQLTRSLGQNFLHDQNQLRKIVEAAELSPDEKVLEIGPGLGPLTELLLEKAGEVLAIEMDRRLVEVLREQFASTKNLNLLHDDALEFLRREPRDWSDWKLVANLPYNVAVPVLLTMLARLPSLRRVLVMVQLEVAERLAAKPGGDAYGVPSVKAAWYGTARLAGTIGRQVFWPAPRVDSGLVALDRGVAPETTAGREDVFAVIDAAFGQRRKTLRAALAGWAGSPAAAEISLRAAGIDPGARGETLDVTAFARIAEQRPVQPTASSPVPPARR